MQWKLEGSITIYTILDITRNQGEVGWKFTYKLALIHSAETEERFYKDMMRDLNTKQNDGEEEFGGEISLDAVSTTGMWLDDITANWKLAGRRLSQIIIGLRNK